MNEIYVLMADIDETLHSYDESFGVAVTTEAEAKRFVEEGPIESSKSYHKLIVFENKDDAVKHAFPGYYKEKT